MRMEKTKREKILVSEALMQFLKVVSNKTRIRILSLLTEGEKRVSDIQEALGAKQSYVSQQLQILKNKGFLDFRREGTQIYYRLKDDKIIKLLKILEKEV